MKLILLRFILQVLLAIQIIQHYNKFFLKNINKFSIMALSQEIKNGIAFAAQMGFDKLHLAPPALTREAMTHAPKNPNPSPVGEVIDITIPKHNIPVRIYIPEGEGSFPIISYFHGGGFVLMNLDTHDEICRQLSVKTNAVVMSV